MYHVVELFLTFECNQFGFDEYCMLFNCILNVKLQYYKAFALRVQ